MADTDSVEKPEATKPVEKQSKEQAAPKKQARKYFLPETGQVVEANNAEDAAKQVNTEKGNKG